MNRSPFMADARKLYLVDAMSNIHRAYHAIQRLSTSAGQAHQRHLRLRDDARARCCASTLPTTSRSAWDGPETDRCATTAYAEYKANRAADGRRPRRPRFRTSAASSTPTGSRSWSCPVTRPTTSSGRSRRRPPRTASTSSSSRRTRTCCSSSARASACSTPGRETFLDEAGVQEFFGVSPGAGRRRPRAHGRQRRQHPRRARRRAGHREEVDLGSTATSTTLLAKAGRDQGKVGESLRQHREDADPLARARRDPDGPADPLRAGRASALREPDARSSKDLFVELEFHSLAAEIERESRDGPRDPALAARRAGRAASRGRAQRAVRRRAPDARGSDVLLAVSDGPDVEIAEESTPEILDRWKGLDRPGRPITAGRREAARRSARRGQGGASPATSSTSASRSTCCRPASASSDFEPIGLPAARAERVTANKEAGVVSLRAARGLRDRDARTAGSPSARVGTRALAATASRGARASGRRSRRSTAEIERPLTPVLARMELAGVADRRPLLERDVGRGWRRTCARLEAEDLGRKPARSSTSTRPSSSGRSSSRSSDYPVVQEDREDASPLRRASRS